jgi:hypothetical protein
MAPELAVYLYRDTPARGLRPDILRWKGLRIVAQGSLRQDTGEDIGSQETAHLLDEHDLQLAACKGSIFGYREVPPHSSDRWRRWLTVPRESYPRV